MICSFFQNIPLASLMFQIACQFWRLMDFLLRWIPRNIYNSGHLPCFYLSFEVYYVFVAQFSKKLQFSAIWGLENAKIVKVELKICKIPQFKALIMPNFISGPKMAPFFGIKSLSKGGEKTHTPQSTSAEKSPGTNRVKYSGYHLRIDKAHFK